MLYVFLGPGAQLVKSLTRPLPFLEPEEITFKNFSEEYTSLLHADNIAPSYLKYLQLLYKYPTLSKYKSFEVFENLFCHKEKDGGNAIRQTEK